MYAIALSGAIMIAISLAMIANPEGWARAIVRFSRMRYMHPFEIVTRIGFGLLFIVYAEQSKFPTLIRVMGYLLLAVGLGLVLLPPSYHRRFAVWCAENLAQYFRPAGIASFAFGVFLIYAAI